MSSIPEQLVYTVSGVVVGAFLSSLGFLFRSNVDRKKTINEAFYCLLELRHLFRTILSWDSAKLSSQFMKAMKKRFPELTPEEEIEVLATIEGQLDEQFRQLCSGLLRPDAKQFSQWFSEAIKRLTSVEPYLAFELSGSKNVQALLDILEDMVAGSLPDDQTPSSPSRGEIHDKLQRQVVEQAFDALGRHIRILAKKSGMRMYFRAVRGTREVARDVLMSEEEAETLVEGLLDRILSVPDTAQLGAYTEEQLDPNVRLESAAQQAHADG